MSVVPLRWENSFHTIWPVEERRESLLHSHAVIRAANHRFLLALVRYKTTAELNIDNVRMQW